MLGDVPLLNHQFDNSKQDAVNDKLKQLHDSLLGDVERNDPSFDVFKRNTEGDDLISQAKIFLTKDQEVRDKLGGPTVKREKFQTNYWTEWNRDKNILVGESARELAQTKIEDPYLVKLKRKKIAHKKMMEARNATAKQFRTKKVITCSFDAPGKAGTFELPPIGQVNNIDHDTVFVEHLFHNCLPSETIKTSDNHKRPLSSGGNSTRNIFKTKGGALSLAPRKYGSKINSDTAGCDIPPLPSALEKALESRNVNTFGSANRFPNIHNATFNGGDTSTLQQTTVKSTSNNMGHTFSVAARFMETTKETNKNSNNIVNTTISPNDPDVHQCQKTDISAIPDPKDVPGPGYYTVTRLFDPPANPLVKHQTKKLTEAYETFDLLYEKQKIMRQVHYGFHCHVHDHVRFGLCGVPGTASGAQYSQDDIVGDQDSQHSLRSLGVTLLPNMCHCCHHTHYDTRRLRDPVIVRQAKEDIAVELKEMEDKKKAEQEAEDLLLGRHLRKLHETTHLSSSQRLQDEERQSISGIDNLSNNSNNNNNNSVTVQDSTPMNMPTKPAVSLSLSSTSQQPTTSSQCPLPQRDITQFYSKRKKKEIRDARIAKARAVRKVRDEDSFLQAVHEAGLIPQPVYELTALMTAALKEDIEAIRVMAQNMINPNERQPETFQTALHHAAHANKVKSVMAILKYFHPEYQLKYRKNTTDNIYRHPLQLNLRDHQGDTPLHIACRAGYLEVVEALTSDVRCRPALPPTTQSQNRLDWLNFIISGGKLDKGDDSAAENQRNHRGEFETDLCYRFHNRTIGHRMWQCVNAAILRKLQEMSSTNQQPMSATNYNPTTQVDNTAGTVNNQSESRHLSSKSVPALPTYGKK